MSVIPRYDFQDAAAKAGSRKAYAFYSTAATDCWTRDTNEAMIKRIWFRPRVMKNVAAVDTSTTVLNIPVKMPLFVCPTGLAKLINPDGEKALARASQSSGILEIVSREGQVLARHRYVKLIRSRSHLLQVILSRTSCKRPPITLSSSNCI
jgi:L-lactate dehydrogenase (cytochrome)